MRWLNRDPIEEEGGLNLYTFCESRPVVNFDSLGLSVVKEHLVVLYDLTTGIKKNSMIAYTDASAIVQVSCKCSKARWSLDSVKVDVKITVHHQKGGYGSNFLAGVFAQKSEMEHVGDIRSGVRNLISPSVDIEELKLRLLSYNERSTCVDVNKRTIAGLVAKLINKILQDSVERRDASGNHTWRGP